MAWMGGMKGILSFWGLDSSISRDDGKYGRTP